MKNLRLNVLTTAVCFSLAASAVAQVANPSFENPITFDGPPFVGSWEGFNASGASAGNSALLPRTGLQSLQLSILITENSFAGVFQDMPGLLSGVEYTFGGWHATTSNPFDVGVEVRIEWRNSGGNNEISRTPNLTPIPGSSFSPFSLTAAVPVGADTARLVYAIQSFGGGPTHNGTVYVDDISFSVVPEPSSLILFGAGGLALVAMRRRRA
jgi:hypothetical protein